MLSDRPFGVLLRNVNILIDEYNDEAWNSNQLSTILKDLTANLFFLEKFRGDYHTKYTKIMYNHTGTISSGKVKADKEVPELYMLRRIMTAAYRVVDALRSNISMIKKEL